MNKALWVCCRRFSDLAVFARIQPSGDSQLAYTDWVREVDVEDAIVANARALFAVWVVFRLGITWWNPEIGRVRFKDTSSWTYLKHDVSSEQIRLEQNVVLVARTYDVSSSKLFVRLIEHVCQVVPDCNIRLDKDGSRFVAIFRRIFVYNLLGFGT